MLWGKVSDKPHEICCYNYAEVLLPHKGRQKAVEGLTTLSICVLGCLEESKAKIVYSERKAGSATIPASTCLSRCNKQRHKNKQMMNTNHGMFQSDHTAQHYSITVLQPPS